MQRTLLSAQGETLLNVDGVHLDGRAFAQLPGQAVDLEQGPQVGQARIGEHAADDPEEEQLGLKGVEQDDRPQSRAQQGKYQREPPALVLQPEELQRPLEVCLLYTSRCV